MPVISRLKNFRELIWFSFNSMDKNEDSGSPGWRESFFMQTRKDVVTVSSPRPSIMFSSKDDTGSQLQKIKHQLSRVLKGFSPPPEVKSGAYNPEVLTSQKRQWANQLQVSLLICLFPFHSSTCAGDIFSVSD